MMQKTKAWLVITLLFALLTGLSWQASWAQDLGQEDLPPTPAPFWPEDFTKDPEQDGRREYLWPAPQMLEQALGGPDLFGYTWQDAGQYQWFEAASGVKITFKNDDDAFSDAIPIGFAFPFYENTYTSLLVSTNGLISFGTGTMVGTNSSLGRDIAPNNLIAVFWDDLSVVGTTGVFYKSGSDAHGNFLAVQWSKVYKTNLPAEPLTFQALLYQNGDIRVQYQQLGSVVDSASVGIEDAEGLAGLQYSFNQPNLAAGKGVLFVRPAPAARVKLLARHFSAFTERSRGSISLQVRNTGGLGDDRFNLAIQDLSRQDWALSLYDASGQVLLKDTNSDGVIDTGPVAMGTTFGFQVKAAAPAGTSVGDYLSFNLVARSTRDSTRSQAAALQFAVPASFAQFYVDSDMGIGLEQISAPRRQTLVADRWFSGSSLALAAQSTGGLVGVWELNQEIRIDGIPMTGTSLKFSWVSPQGVLVRTQAPLTNNLVTGQPGWLVADQSIGLAPAPNGEVGVAWLRTSTDYNSGSSRHLKTNYKLYFNRISVGGEVVFPSEFCLTPNDTWIGSEDYNLPEYSSPRIVSLGSNRYYIAWFEERRFIDNTSQVTLFGGLYDQNGAAVAPAAALASNQRGLTTLTDLNLVPLSGGRALILMSQKNLATENYTVVALAANANGTKIFGPAAVTGAAGWKPDALELPSGRILLAWTSATAGKGDGLRYTLLDGGSFQPVWGSPRSLESRSDHAQDHISLASDPEGRAAITWMDAEGSDYLFYALVGQDGALITPPMVFYPQVLTGSNIGTNQTGQGSAPHNPHFPLYLPVLRR